MNFEDISVQQQADKPAAHPRRGRSSPVMRDWSRLLAEAEQERRGQQRHKSSLRVVLLHTNGGQELCAVRNISSGGLQGRVYTRRERGEMLSVELKPGCAVPARIAWVRDWQIGVEFLCAIDVDDLLGIWSNDDSGEKVRLPRLEVRCPARLQIGPRSYAVRLCDIAEGGAKIEMRTAMKKLRSVTLTLPDLPPCRGYVRWADGLRLGIGFEEPLPHDVIARWAESRRGKADPVLETTPGRSSAA